MTDEQRPVNEPDPLAAPLPAEGSLFDPASPASTSTAEVPAATQPGPVDFGGGAPGLEEAPAFSQSTSGPTPQEPLPPAGTIPPAGAAPPPPRPPAGRGATYVNGTTGDDRLLGALTWLSLVILALPLLSVVLLIAENNKNQPFQRYHAVTSIVFWAAAIVYEIVATVIYIVGSALTFGCGLACLLPLFFVPHVIGLYYAYEAYMGREPVIPFISDLVRKNGWA